MAKRMGYSVVGLPHYTVWHLYEPSVDDIRHMEEMEQERLAREKEEKERAERAQKIKEEFGDQGSQWESDKKIIEKIGKNEEQIKTEHDAAVAAQDGKGKGAAQDTVEGVAQEENAASSKGEKVKDAKVKDDKPKAENGKDTKPKDDAAKKEKAKGESAEKAVEEKNI